MPAVCHDAFAGPRGRAKRKARQRGPSLRRKSAVKQPVIEKIDFRLTLLPSLANLRHHEQHWVEFW
jgi:hypothetical protein